MIRGCYSFGTDWWAVGVMAYQMTTGRVCILEEEIQLFYLIVCCNIIVSISWNDQVKAL